MPTYGLYKTTIKGYIFITPQGFDMYAGLEYWINKAVDFNKTLTK